MLHKSPSPRPSPIGWEYVFSGMVGMARCAVPARVVAGGTNIRATLALERVAPLHAARTSQRDAPTTLNTYGWERGETSSGGRRIQPRDGSHFTRGLPEKWLVV